jgi:hypothetical protein
MPVNFIPTGGYIPVIKKAYQLVCLQTIKDFTILFFFCKAEFKINQQQ